MNQVRNEKCKGELWLSESWLIEQRKEYCDGLGTERMDEGHLGEEEEHDLMLEVVSQEEDHK